MSGMMIREENLYAARPAVAPLLSQRILEEPEQHFPESDSHLDEAMLTAAGALVSFYRGNWVLNRIANDRGRVIGAMIMLDLHFGRGCQGFTVAELRTQALRCHVASPNRMTAFAGLLRSSGYLTAMPAPDARKRKLVPSASLIDLHRRRMRALLGGTIILNPDLAPAMQALEDDGVLAAMEHAYLRYWRAGCRITGHFPALEGFVERDAGFTLLCLLMGGAAKGQSYRISDLSRYFAISRTHALVVMREAIRCGLAEREVETGAFTGTPLLTAAMRPLFAQLFAVQAGVAREALAPSAEAGTRPRAMDWT
jgi:hypothetical protein